MGEGQIRSHVQSYPCRELAEESGGEDDGETKNLRGHDCGQRHGSAQQNQSKTPPPQSILSRRHTPYFPDIPGVSGITVSSKTSPCPRAAGRLGRAAGGGCWPQRCRRRSRRRRRTAAARGKHNRTGCCAAMVYRWQMRGKHI